MFLTAIAGKTRQLDTLYIARQQDSPGSSGGEHQEQFGDWYAACWCRPGRRISRALRTAPLRRWRAPTAFPLEDARRPVFESYKMSVAPSLLADLVEEPTVSWSMPLVLQIVRRPGQPAADQRAPPRGAGVLPARRWLSHDFVHGTEFRTRRRARPRGSSRRYESS